MRGCPALRFSGHAHTRTHTRAHGHTHTFGAGAEAIAGLLPPSFALSTGFFPLVPTVPAVDDDARSEGETAPPAGECEAFPSAPVADEAAGVVSAVNGFVLSPPVERNRSQVEKGKGEGLETPIHTVAKSQEGF